MRRKREAGAHGDCSSRPQARKFGRTAMTSSGAARSSRSCKSSFQPVYGDKRRAFCSDTCRKRHVRRLKGNRYRKRARYHGVAYEPVNPITVFERDGWRCQLCGTRTPRRLRGTLEPSAPELDHIIPMAVGGEHSYRNTHCACRSCNGAKAARPLGQLRLF